MTTSLLYCWDWTARWPWNHSRCHQSQTSPEQTYW